MNRYFMVFLLVVMIGITPGGVWASPIGAKAVYVRGEVFAERGDAPRAVVELGYAFLQGDKVITAKDGIVEIMLDNGNLIRIDVNSQFVIKTLERNEESKSTFAIFNLILGRVKTSVAKLATLESKFEYVTKAAVVGIAGTPPWVLFFDGENAAVDLLGMEGEEGSVFVRGFDPQGTMVTLLANMGTVIRVGEPPLPPFPLSFERRRMLDQVIPFSFQQEAGGEGEEGSKAGPPPEPAQPEKTETEEPSGPTVSETLVTDSISNSVSMPVKPSGGSVDTVSGASRMTSGEQGTVGEVGAGQQAPSTAQFQIQVNY